MPTTQPGAPVIHRFLGIGLIAIGCLFLILRYIGIAPLPAADSSASTIGYVLAAVSIALVAIAFVILKPRAPGRRAGESIEQVWSNAQTNEKILLVWFLMEGAGMIAGIGFFLSGEVLAAAAMGVAIVMFWWNGPDTFDKP